MKNSKTIALLLGATLLATLACSCKSICDTPKEDTCKKETATIKKTFSPWIVYNEGDDLMELADYVDELSMISVFGNIRKCKNFEQFQELKKKHGFKTLMAVSADVHAYKTPERRKGTIEAWSSRSIKYGYDGVDIDIEHMPVDSMPEYMLFLEEFSKVMKEKGQILTMCVGFYPPFVEEPFAWWYDPANIAQHVEQVRVMGYDCYWAWGKNIEKLKHRKDCYGMGPACSYPFLDEAIEYWSKHVPKEKLVVGLPAYANSYNLDPAGLGNKQGNVYAQVNDPKDIDKTKPVHRYWSWVDRLEVLIYTDTEGRLRQQFICNEESTKALLEVLDKHDVRHVGVWAYGFSNPEEKAVIDVMVDWVNK